MTLVLEKITILYGKKYTFSLNINMLIFLTEKYI